MQHETNGIAQSFSNQVNAGWQTPDFYQELDLDKAKTVVQHGDLPHLFLTAFEKAAHSKSSNDMSDVTFPRVGVAALVELDVRLNTLLWVVEMAGFTGKARDYEPNRYPEDAAFIIAYSLPGSIGKHLFRCGGGCPGKALANFAKLYPAQYSHVTNIYLDKRSLHGCTVN